MAKRRVLVTGASGYVASLVLPALRDRYDCTLIDVRATDRNGDPVPGLKLADLTQPDLEQCRPWFRGQDAVVHLGYIHPPSGLQAGKSRENYYTERRNVDMAFAVYQLAMEEGLQRVVMASSNHAADWYEDLIHAKKKDLVDPWERAVSDNFYGWAKEAYEHLGFVYACGRLGRQLEVVQLRIGAPREIDAAKFAATGADGDGADSDGGFNHRWYHRDLGAYISARDLSQLVAKSLDAPDIRDAHGIPFQIFYGISDNTRKFWSIANARQVIGYSPEDDSEAKFAEGIRERLLPLGGPVPPAAFNPGPGTA